MGSEPILQLRDGRHENLVPGCWRRNA